MSKDLMLVEDCYDLPVNSGTYSYVSEVGGTLKADEAKDILSSPGYFRRSSEPVLGKIIGNYFVPNGKTLNNRFYSEDLWRNTLGRPDVKRKLDDGMLGMMEHPPLLEFYTKEGQITGSHPIYTCIVTKKLYMTNESGKQVGKGEGYIVDTPVGKILDVLLRATDESGQPLVRLYMSSRALGKYVGKTKDNYLIMDPLNYYLSTFDVVRNPGLPSATFKYIPTREDTDILVEKLVGEILESSSLQSKFLRSYLPSSKLLHEILRSRKE